MNRVRRVKIRYLVCVLILGICSAWILVTTKGNWIVWVMLVVILITPGRIAGYYWRSLFRGLKSLNRGHYRDAIEHLTQFLRMLEERPWIKKLSWYGGLIYTREVEAMALANLGVAHINLGELEIAEEKLGASLKVDPEYCLAHYNLGVLYRMQEKLRASEVAFGRAVALGYSQTAVDSFIKSVSKVYANVQGGRTDPGD